jgi:integrase/recombinase XerD
MGTLMENACLRYLTYLRDEQGSATNTILAYKADLQQFVHVIAAQSGGDASLGAIHPASLSKYVRWLEKQGYRPATVARKIAAVRSFLDYLKTHERRDELQFSEVLRIPPAPRRRPRVLTSVELQNLLQAPASVDHPRAKRDHAILTLLYATGLRVAEAINLQLNDVDLDFGKIQIRTTRETNMSLGEAVEPMRRYLNDGRPHLARNPNEKALFLNQRGKRLSRQGLWLVVKRWANKVGLGQEISPHTFRHTLAQDLLNRGKTKREVLQILGLSSPNALWVQRENNPE